MAKLEDIDVKDLEAALDDASEKKETQRLMAAIIYKRGPSVPMIAEWLDTREATIYRWFDRLEDEPIAQAIQDRPKPGRPPKLAEEELESFREAVKKPPTESGYDEPAWSTNLAQTFLEEEFDQEYTSRHVQRMLKDAGLTHQTPRPQPPTADEDERKQYWQQVKKTD